MLETLFEIIAIICSVPPKFVIAVFSTHQTEEHSQAAFGLFG